MIKSRKKSEQGQVLLLVLLAMAALATVMLSVISRSVSEVSVTSREEESLRAFSAAEAGVEEALIVGEVGTVRQGSLEVEASGETATISTYSADIQNYPEVPTAYAYPFDLQSGETASVWLATREGDEILPCTGTNCFTGNSFNLCWGKQSTPGDPAVYVNIVFRTGAGDYASVSNGYDSNSSRATLGNKFTVVSGGGNIAGQAYPNCTTINLTNFGPTNFDIKAAGDPILMRVTMLYNGLNRHVFGVTSGSPFPTQGRRVTSEGQSGDVTRRIDAFLLNPEMPFIFDGALYSAQSITK